MGLPLLGIHRRGVALLAEGVDRNMLGPCDRLVHPNVALLAEGVDRNHHAMRAATEVMPSPSSRRAWIEITRSRQRSRRRPSRPPRGGRG